MIELDFGESQGVPTLWIIVNDRKDFGPLRQLILELSNGSRDSIDVLFDRELFRASASVQSLNFAATSETKKGKVDTSLGISGSGFVWKQPALDLGHHIAETRRNALQARPSILRLSEHCNYGVSRRGSA
jgi:hypothetical protein